MYLLHEFDDDPLLSTLPAGCLAINVRTGEIPEGVLYPPLVPGNLPLVIVDAPAYSANIPQYDGGAFVGMDLVNVPAGQEAILRPASWAAVESYLAYVQARAAANPPV